MNTDGGNVEDDDDDDDDDDDGDDEDTSDNDGGVDDGNGKADKMLMTVIYIYDNGDCHLNEKEIKEYGFDNDVDDDNECPYVRNVNN